MPIVYDVIQALTNIGGTGRAMQIKDEVLAIWGNNPYHSRYDFDNVIQNVINIHCRKAVTFKRIEYFERIGYGLYQLKTTPPVVPTVAKPEFQPKSGKIKRGETIKITCSTALTDIFYTTDGSIPNNHSTPYEPTKGIQLFTDTTIIAIAYDKNSNKSKTELAHYTVVKIAIDQEKKKKVEKAAVDIVVEHCVGLGYEPEGVESENVGWDYNFYQKEEHLKVEIKGNSGTKINVELSPNEYSKMQMSEHINDYRIAIVTDALSDNPDLSILKIEQKDLVFDFGLKKEISISEPTSLKITEK